MLAAGSVAVAPGAPGQLPDLVADAPGAPVLDQDSGESQGRLLVRFDGYVHNQGPGPLEFHGAAPVAGTMTVVTQAGVSGLSPAKILYESNDGHNHWHLRNAARYSLWKGDQSQEVAPAHKVGFCLLDGEGVPGFDPQAYTSGCETGNPLALTVSMGVSAGWRDIYSASTALQWVDASNVAPGNYTVSAEVDPDNVIKEQNESNARNPGTGVVIPGYLPRPLSAGTVSAAGTQVTLQSTAYGNPGTRQFKIVDAPDHGTLSRSPGDGWFSESSLTYTPTPGYNGSDTFRYAARDAGSSFPVNPPSAAVVFSLGTGHPAVVAISGAPVGMYAGTTSQLSASVVGGPNHVTWKVNGVPGGTAAVGRITASGLYSAPAVPPASGWVDVSATSDAGATDTQRIAILPAPKATPADSIDTPSGGGAMSRIVSKRRGRFLVLKMVPRYSGRLKIMIRDGRKRVASRSLKVTRRRAVTARFRLPKAYKGRRAKRLKVTAALRSTRGKIVAVRRARVR